MSAEPNDDAGADAPCQCGERVRQEVHYEVSVMVPQNGPLANETILQLLTAGAARSSPSLQLQRLSRGRRQ